MITEALSLRTGSVKQNLQDKVAASYDYATGQLDVVWQEHYQIM